MQPAGGVAAAGAGAVAREPALEIDRLAGVERPVTTAQQIHPGVRHFYRFAAAGARPARSHDLEQRAPRLDSPQERASRLNTHRFSGELRLNFRLALASAFRGAACQRQHSYRRPRPLHPPTAGA